MTSIPQRRARLGAAAWPRLNRVINLWTCLLGAIAGLVAVFLGLAVDAWRHSAPGAGEESLLSASNPGHAIAGAGLVLTTGSVLMALTVIALENRARTGAALRLSAVTGSWLLVTAAGVGALAYIASTGATVGHEHPAGMAAGHPHEAGNHDHGPHATFSQITTLGDAQVASLFPAGLVQKAEVPSLRQQVQITASVVADINTIAAAERTGYRLITTDVDYMGLHYLNLEHVTDGVFDPTKPEGLLFSRIDGPEPTLVGAWFLQVPGSGDVTWETAPEGFAGLADYWHGHKNVCLPFEDEGVSEASCTSRGGRFVLDSRWMMHAWVVDSFENPDGVFAYMHRPLFARQVAAGNLRADADGDGLNDLDEIAVGLSPIHTDSDADGLPDATTVAALTIALNALPDAAFASGDERSQLLELAAQASIALGRGDQDEARRAMSQLRGLLGRCVIANADTPWLEWCARRAEAAAVVSAVALAHGMEQ